MGLLVPPQNAPERGLLITMKTLPNRLPHLKSGWEYLGAGEAFSAPNEDIATLMPERIGWKYGSGWAGLHSSVHYALRIGSAIHEKMCKPERPALPLVEMGKTYKNRHGEKVVIHSVTGPNPDFPVIISYFEAGNWKAGRATATGKDWGLIEVREPREWKGSISKNSGILFNYDEGDEEDPKYEVVAVREILP